MITKHITEETVDLYGLIETALDEPVRISSERGTVIMISEEEWENMLETVYLMGVPGLAEDIEEGRQIPESELVRWNRDL